ncbi:hypothetical protein LTR28_009325, partial [Elasticomyces elasticus]
MSRRPNAAADRAAQNQQTLKTVVKIESNKSCADCKRNKRTKIENFIRTKYDSKRWVMDGPMPDPATLDVNGDDDVPLQVVQEKVKLERSSSQRAAASNPLPRIPQARQNIDLFGDDSASSLPRPSTTEPTISRPPPPRGPPPPPKQTKPGDSLLGLDFFGSSQSPPP